MAREEEIQGVASMMPDLAARQPAEGDLDFPDEEHEHLCCPGHEPSSELPVEEGALADRRRQPCRG